MRRWSFVFLFAIVLSFSVVRFAQALPYDFDLGSGSSINIDNTNNALQLYAVVNPNLDDISFSLSEGDSRSFRFATVGTSESWINPDDISPRTVSASINFDNPNLIQSVNGVSVGFTGNLSFTQGWNLTWNDPVLVETDGLKFSIDLTNISYQSWFWQGPAGSAEVYAKIKLISEPNSSNDDPPISSVPDADIMWLLGPSFIALGLLGRKKKSSKQY